MSTAYPQIPYGWADFEAMRRERTLYVDKTRFLHDLEQERFAFLIRPRRFGKSCWVALLESYYDRNRAQSGRGRGAGRDERVVQWLPLRQTRVAYQDVYNTDMVLYYVKASVPGRGNPTS